MMRKQEKGKPWETVGRKTRGWGFGRELRKLSGVTLVRLHGKPSETMGRQSKGPTAWTGPVWFSYGSPAAGYFASGQIACKERKIL